MKTFNLYLYSNDTSTHAQTMVKIKFKHDEIQTIMQQLYGYLDEKCDRKIFGLFEEKGSHFTKKIK